MLFLEEVGCWLILEDVRVTLGGGWVLVDGS